MEVVTGKRQEVPTAKVVETSLRSVPPEGFEPPTSGTNVRRFPIERTRPVRERERVATITHLEGVVAIGSVR